MARFQEYRLFSFLVVFSSFLPPFHVHLDLESRNHATRLAPVVVVPIKYRVCNTTMQPAIRLRKTHEVSAPHASRPASPRPVLRKLPCTTQAPTAPRLPRLRMHSLAMLRALRSRNKHTEPTTSLRHPSQES